MINLADIEKQLFFIVGCPRSGTTLLQSSLASHPNVTLPHETGFYSIIYQRYAKKWGELSNSGDFEEALATTLNFNRIKALNLDYNLIRSYCQDQSESWETIFLAILATYAQQHNVSRIGEKSPRHFAYIGLLKERFPHAKFIHVIRDPRAVVLSIMKAPFGSNKIGNSCSLWHSAMTTHQEYSEQLGEQRYQVVKYEDMVEQPETVLKQVSDFLNMQFSPQMLEFHQRKELGFHPKYINHMSNTLKPIFTSSIDKWKNELSLSQIAIIQAVLKKEMELMGYEPIEAHTILPWMQYKIDIWSESLSNRLQKFRRTMKKRKRKINSSQ